MQTYSLECTTCLLKLELIAKAVFVLECGQINKSNTGRLMTQKGAINTPYRGSGIRDHTVLSATRQR